MIADTILERAGFVKDNLKSFIDYWTLGMQILVDSLFDPADDNSHEIITVPPEFYTTFYNEIRSYCFTDAYNASAKGQGMQPCLWAGTVKLENGDLSFPNYQWISKDYSGWWSYLSSEEIDACANLMKEYNLNLHSYSDYPTEPTVLNYNGSMSFSFKPKNHTNSDMGYEFTDFNGTQQRTFTVEFLNGDFVDDGDYVDFSMGFADLRGGALRGLYKRPFMMVTDNQTACTDYVSANGATNNYTETITPGDGDPFTIYYGDNYIIYYIPNGNKLSYDDIQINTQRVVNIIVNDNPDMEPVHVPTYDENKYGPEPPTPEDDPSDDQESGGIYLGAQGMCNLYYMTKDEIKNLQNWFRGSVFSPGIQIPANFDPSNQLIGLMAFPIELGGDVENTTITFRTADNQAVDTGVSCQGAWGDDLKFDMGTIDIPARMQERGVPFLDYSSQIEVYIPFCNVVQLDVQQVIGTTLKCEMWISPATGDVSAMLSSGTHPVAYTSGNCAQQLPISVSSYGAIAGAKLAAENKMTQAVFQAAQNVVKDITNAGAITSAVSNHTAVNGQGLVEFSRIPQVQSNTGLAVGAGIKAGGDIINTALNLTATNLDNRYALQVAKNSAPTHVSGSFGACTSWHFPNYCYVKITRPHFQKPDNYGHTEAVPVVATKQLSELTGLTTCVNPDVSGIGTATMQELETIKGYLMTGVIL